MNNDLKNHLIANHSYREDKDGNRLDKPSKPFHYDINAGQVESYETTYKSAKTVVELPTLEEFVSNLQYSIGWISFENEKVDTKHECLRLIFLYKDFISQLLNLSMFIPSLDGKLLEEPENWSDYLKEDICYTNEWISGCEDYEAALNNVLFEGWDIDFTNEHVLYLSNPKHDRMMFFRNNKVYYSDGINHGNELKKISDFLPFGVKLKQQEMKKLTIFNETTSMTFSIPDEYNEESCVEYHVICIEKEMALIDELNQSFDGIWKTFFGNDHPGSLCVEFKSKPSKYTTQEIEEIANSQHGGIWFDSEMFRNWFNDTLKMKGENEKTVTNHVAENLFCTSYNEVKKEFEENQPNETKYRFVEVRKYKCFSEYFYHFDFGMPYCATFSSYIHHEFDKGRDYTKEEIEEILLKK